MAKYSSLQCHSLSELPDTAEINRSSSIYVTLPVVVLAFQKLKLGVLLVTDFSEIPELGFAHSQLPVSLPENFIFNEKRLPLSKVLAVGVPSSKVDYVWRELQLFGPQMRGFDYSRSDDCNFLRLCVLAVLNMKLNIYNGFLEGFYGGMTVLNKDRFDRPGCLGDVNIDIFRAFMRRLGQNIDCSNYDRMIHCFPVDKFISRDKLPGMKSVLPQKTSGTTTLATKSGLSSYLQDEKPLKFRKLTPSEAVYRQQPTQLQQPSQLQHPPQVQPYIQDPTQLQFSSQLQYPSQPQHPNQRQQPLLIQNICQLKNKAQLQYHAQLSSTSDEETPVNSQSEPFLEKSNGNKARQLWTLYRVNEISFKQFCRLECSELHPKACFRIRCTIKEITPNVENVFIKPYRGTLSIAQICFGTTDSKGSKESVRVEINTAEEGCEFFGLLEVEEAIDKIAELHRDLNLLLSKEVNLEVTAKSIQFKLGYTLMYWSPTSTLEELIKD